MIEAFGGHTPSLDPSAWAHPGAHLIGQVVLGPRASVWPGAVLRGDMGRIRVGEDSNLQDGVVAHTTEDVSVVEVGARVTVGHRAILHGCVVEDDCLIGMGSILLDNAVIGAGSVVGAGAVVPAGRVIPPGSLVLGMPGKVARQVTDKDREWIAYSWRVYVERAAVWRAGGAG